MEPLTVRQAEILTLIEDHLRSHGHPPTLRQMGEALGIRSPNGVRDHLLALERKGYLRRGSHQSRALTLASIPSGDPTGQARRLPLVGRIAAGRPLLSEENLEGWIILDASLAPSGGEMFALRVRGDSMVEDGILDGDYVFVRRQVEATRGDIVVALVEGEATLKRFYLEGGRVRLQPANAALEPIVIDGEEGRDVRILGVVVGVYRKIQ